MKRKADDTLHIHEILRQSSSVSETGITPRIMDNSIYYETYNAPVIPSRSEWSEQELRILVQSMRILSERIQSDIVYQSMNEKTRYLIVSIII